MPTYLAVVDDDESGARALARLLRAAGYVAVVYLSAEAFLGDRKRPVFDCLFLDIQLGGMSGMELSQQLAASGCTTPVIFLTAQEDHGNRQEAPPVTGTAYLRKSEPAESLLATLRRAIGLGAPASDQKSGSRP